MTARRPKAHEARPSPAPRPLSPTEKRAQVLLNWAQQPVKNVAAVARKCKVDRRFAARWVSRLQQLSLPTDMARRGRPRKLDAAGVQFVEQQVRSLGTVARVAAAVRDHTPQQQPVSARTVRRVLKEVGYKWKRCRYRMKLTAAHVANRLAYARAHRDNGRAWRHILFTDSAYLYCDRGAAKWVPSSEMND